MSARIVVRRVALAVVLVTTVGCNDDGGQGLVAGSESTETTTTDSPASTIAIDPGSAREYEVTATVLESPEHGPELCLEVEESYPPQCSGFGLVGWDWASAEGEESASGTTWGDYHVVGTWDGERLTVTKAPGDPEWDDQRGEPLDFRSPCPAPPGGWRVEDPALAGATALTAVSEAARADPDFSGMWVDQSINPALADGDVDTGEGELMNDPALLVVNVRTTGAVDVVTAALREVWGGALCVTVAERTLAELRSIQDQLVHPEVLASSVDEVGNVVDVLVDVADEARVAHFDERFGAGATTVRGWLRPLSTD